MSMPNNSVELLIGEVDEKLSLYRKEHRGLSWREKVLLLVDLTSSVKQLAKHSNPRTANIGARERLRLYFTEHVGIVIAAAELEVVSGISEYARRVRELRVEDGYKILTGNSRNRDTGITLGPDEYLLLDRNPDHTAARRWSIANRIRREHAGGSRGRLLRYFLANVGQIVTNDELAYVARAKEYGRRVRELRTELGYAVSTKFTGRPDLRMGEYVLESSNRKAEPHDRKIAFEVQKAVYERDNSTCRLCGWNRARWSKRDPRILELHHLSEHAAGGNNIAQNLAVLCSRCHDDVHAGRRRLPADLIG